MQSTFSLVVFGAVAISIVMSIVFLISKGSVYDQIGQGGLGDERGSAPDWGQEGAWSRAPGGEAPMGAGEYGGAHGSIHDGSAQHTAERDEEIRQMLRARSERRLRRGEDELDIEAELARLTAPQQAPAPRQDPGIAEEVLQLVVARNERRERQGLEPLDVEAEVARTIAELDV